MRVKLILLVLVIFFLASCTPKQAANEQGKPAIYVVEGPMAKTFVVGEKDPLAWEEQTKSKRSGLNSARALREDNDTQVEFKIKNKLSNVVRSVDNKLIIGFDKEIDNPVWKEVKS